MENEITTPEPGITVRITSRFQSLLTTWLQDWESLTLYQKVLPVGLILPYWVLLYLLNGLRGDHILIGGSILLLSYMGAKGRAFLSFSLPFFLTGIVYDSQRYYSDWIRGPVHVTEPYHFDLYFFGITTSTGRLTPNEWWQLHTHPLLDFISGFAYLAFVIVFVLIAAYFFFFIKHFRAKEIPWAFFWLNVLGYSTYYWYAAAPPWYVSLYGLGPAKMDVAANVAGCARFDQLLGTHFFSEMYGRAADVFGAVPSLHVAYPLLAVLYSFQLGSARIVSVLFYAIMCFSAVYLNHHYVLDILWGSAYAVLLWAIMNYLHSRRVVQL